MNVQNKLKISFAASISMIIFIGQLRSVGRTIGFSLLFIRLEKRRWGMEINAARKKISPTFFTELGDLESFETMLFFLNRWRKTAGAAVQPPFFLLKSFQSGSCSLKLTYTCLSTNNSGSWKGNEVAGFVVFLQ